MMTDTAAAAPSVSASDTIRTTGILHFTRSAGAPRGSKVLFAASGLQAHAIERALFVHAVRQQLFRAGQDAASCQSERARRGWASSRLHGRGERVRPRACSP